MDALVFEEGAILQHALNDGRKMLEENEQLRKTISDLSSENAGLNADLDSMDAVLKKKTAAIEVKNGLIDGLEIECGKLEKERDKLLKELREARKEYDDLKYSKVICPGEAARYYLEEYRKLKRENDDLKKLYEKILVLTDKTTDMVVAVIDQKSRKEHTP